MGLPRSAFVATRRKNLSNYEAFGRDLFMYDYSMGANNNVFRVV